MRSMRLSGSKDPTDKSSGSRPNGQLVRAVMKSASAPHGARARVSPRSAPPRAHRTPSSATRRRQLREAIIRPLCDLGGMTVVSLLDLQVYLYSEVDRLAGLRAGTPRRWIDGYQRAGKTYEPILRTSAVDTEWVTWGEFVEAACWWSTATRTSLPLGSGGP